MGILIESRKEAHFASLTKGEKEMSRPGYLAYNGHERKSKTICWSGLEEGGRPLLILSRLATIVDEFRSLIQQCLLDQTSKLAIMTRSQVSVYIGAFFAHARTRENTFDRVRYCHSMKIHYLPFRSFVSARTMREKGREWAWQEFFECLEFWI